jgi:hypothetical protein
MQMQMQIQIQMQMQNKGLKGNTIQLAVIVPTIPPIIFNIS